MRTFQTPHPARGKTGKKQYVCNALLSIINKQTKAEESVSCGELVFFPRHDRRCDIFAQSLCYISFLLGYLQNHPHSSVCACEDGTPACGEKTLHALPCKANKEALKLNSWGLQTLKKQNTSGICLRCWNRVTALLNHYKIKSYIPQWNQDRHRVSAHTCNLHLGFDCMNTYILHEGFLDYLHDFTD